MSGVDKSVIRINKNIMAIDVRSNIENHPKIHLGLNPILFFMGRELRYVQKLNIEIRKKHLRELFIEDFLREEQELRQVEKAYLNTQP